MQYWFCSVVLLCILHITPSGLYFGLSASSVKSLNVILFLIDEFSIDVENKPFSQHLHSFPIFYAFLLNVYKTDRKKKIWGEKSPQPRFVPLEKGPVSQEQPSITLTVFLANLSRAAPCVLKMATLAFSRSFLSIPSFLGMEPTRIAASMSLKPTSTLSVGMTSVAPRDEKAF